jgi:hypothetical protein
MADDLDDFFDEIEEAVAEVTEKGEDAVVEEPIAEASTEDRPTKRIKVAVASAPARPKGAVVAASAASSSLTTKKAQQQQQQQMAPPPPPPPPPSYPNPNSSNNNNNNHHHHSNNNDRYFGPGSNGRGSGNRPGMNLPPLPPGPMPPLPPGPSPPPGFSNSTSNNHQNSNNNSNNSNSNSNSNSNKQAKPVVRMAAGKSWVDSTLSEWPENDFRIFVGNLGADVDDTMLYNHFKSRYASVAMSKIVRDAKDDNKSKGYGFVSFLQPLDCAKAIREQDQAWLGSRPVRVKRSDWQERNKSTVRKKHNKEKKQQKKRGGGIGGSRY